MTSLGSLRGPLSGPRSQLSVPGLFLTEPGQPTSGILAMPLPSPTALQPSSLRTPGPSLPASCHPRASVPLAVAATTSQLVPCEAQP